MNYIKIDCKHTVCVSGPVWDFERRCDIVRAEFFRHGFFFTVEYFYKNRNRAQRAAMGLRAGVMDIPAPDVQPNVLFSAARGRVR